MKKKMWLFIFLITVLLLGGCGSNEGTNASTVNPTNADLPEEIMEAIAESEDGAYDIQVEEKKLSFSLKEDEFIMGAQYDGEVQVFLVGNDAGEVYAYTPGQEKQLLLEGFSSTFVNPVVRWWKLGEQYYTVFNRFFTVFHEDGSRAFQVVMADRDRISDMCITEDGHVVAVWYSNETYKTNLVEIDTATGDMNSRMALPEDYGIAGGSGAGVMIRDGEGIYTYDLKSEEKTWHMKFERTTFNPMMTENTAWDFRMTEEGEVLLLAKDYYTDEWYEETMSKCSFEELGKTILVYQVNFPTAELKEVVTQFNKENETYYVYLDERDFSIDADDYRTQTGIELSTGKGADIIDYFCVDNITSMAQKGVFENLEPYMEKSGMKKEDYFPVAFHDWDTGEECYGIGISMQLSTVYIKEELAEDVTTVDSLLNNLENYEEDAVFSVLYQRFPSAVLNYYLHMTTDMYEMVDWENGTCDFSGELWERLLESSLHYGHGEEKPNSEELTYNFSVGTFQQYGMFDLETKGLGMVPLGYPTEDGLMHKVFLDYVCINAASENKEGAWEFIQYLLSAKSQQKLATMQFPVLKSAYESECRRELAQPSIIDMVDFEPVYTTQEHIDRVTQLLEEAQVAPLHTEYVLDIILEESESYFSGTKTIEQVSEIIENRVGLYLDEQY